jgi:hypothetical protein
MSFWLGMKGANLTRRVNGAYGTVPANFLFLEYEHLFAMLHCFLAMERQICVASAGKVATPGPLA